MAFTIGNSASAFPAPPSLTAPSANDPIEPFLDRLIGPLRIQLIGLTGAGKTTLVGEFADYLFEQRRQRTLYYQIDRGSPTSIGGYIKRNIIINVERGEKNPFIWVEKAAQGLIPVRGKWIAPPPALNIGAVVFDSATGISEDQLKDVRDSQATSAPIGPKAYSFNISDGDDTIKIGTTDKSHYGIIQGRITDAMWESQKLPYHLIWTANLRGNGKEARDNQVAVPTTALGADLGGRALVDISPRWFQYTFALMKQHIPNKPPVRRLYLDSHVDPNVGGLASIVGNPRVPLLGNMDGRGVEVPAFIEPASLVRALSVLYRRQAAAEVDIDERLQLTPEELDIRKRLGL